MTLCKECKTEVHGFNFQMVILKDSLWRQISDKWKDVLCVTCIEKKLGRPIEESDLKLTDEGKVIPVNEMFLQNRGLTKQQTDKAKSEEKGFGRVARLDYDPWNHWMRPF